MPAISTLSALASRSESPGSVPHPLMTEPWGCVKDGSHAWLGFTCAACHTSELEFAGKRFRVDGGAALADVGAMLLNLTASVQETVEQDDKFQRFADRLLGAESADHSHAILRDRLSEYLEFRQLYDRRNHSELVDGPARLDAFGRIFNKALHEVAAGPDNFNPPNAPVSIPFLWRTDQSDFVQWVGSASNAKIGPLARNTGEVLGVFANVDVEHTPLVSHRLSLFCSHPKPNGPQETAPRFMGPGLAGEVSRHRPRAGPPRFGALPRELRQMPPSR